MLLDQRFVTIYSKKYSENIYPYAPYKSIVWDGFYIVDKYSVLGAWKTGCLREKPCRNYASINFDNKTLFFTNRWKYGTPARKKAWEEL